MKVIYLQDQEISYYNGCYYHSKSEHFFERYLSGLSLNDSLKVYCGIIEEKNPDTIKKYKLVSHPRIEFIEIPEFRRFGNIIAIFKQVKKIVKDADFCYLRSGIASSIAGYYCRRKGIPYMAIMNEDIFKNLWLHPNKKFKLFAYPLYWMTYSMVKNADYACYVTKEYLQKRYPCKGRKCGCSDVEFLDIDSRVLDYRIRKIDNMSNPIILGTIGSINAKLKGQDTVIKTLAYFKQKGVIDYRYELVGAGDSERLLKIARDLGVEDYIDFKGEYSHDNVLKWFDHIDIYVHPSHSEGLPRTILEAMTKAVPCICTKVGGVPELINEEYLFSYNGKEIEDLAKLLINMSKNKLKSEASSNFEHSKDYNPFFLEKRRSDFFISAINKVNKRK